MIRRSRFGDLALGRGSFGFRHGIREWLSGITAYRNGNREHCIELTIHASGGRHRGSHWAAVVAYVLLIFGSSKTVVGRTSPYVPRVSASSRTYRLQIRFSLNICMSNQIVVHGFIWIQISWESMECRHLPGGILEIGHATPSQLSLGPCVICMRTRDAMRVQRRCACRYVSVLNST